MFDYQKLRESLGGDSGLPPEVDKLKEQLAKKLGVPIGDIETLAIPVKGGELPEALADKIRKQHIDAMRAELHEAAIVAFIHGKVKWVEGTGCKVGAFRNGPNAGEKALCVISCGDFEDGFWSVIPMFALAGFAQAHKKEAPGLPGMVEKAKALVNYVEFEDGRP